MVDEQEVPTWRRRFEWSKSIEPWDKNLNVLTSLWLEGNLPAEMLRDELREFRNEVNEFAMDLVSRRPDDQELKDTMVQTLNEIQTLESAANEAESAIAPGTWARWEVLRKVAATLGYEIPPFS